MISRECASLACGRLRPRRGVLRTLLLLLAAMVAAGAAAAAAAAGAAEKKAAPGEAPPPQGLLIVLNKEDSTVSFIELLPAKRASERMRLVRTAPTGAQPHEVAISPDGREAWVSNAGAGTVSVFDLGRLEEVASVRHEGFKFPHGSAFTPDGKKFYLACTERGSVFAIDPAARRVLTEIPTGQSDSHMVAMAPDGARIFVPNIGSRSVSVIGTAEDRLLSPILVGRGPEGIAPTPDGRRLLVANQEDSTVSVIDTTALRVVDAFEVGEFPVRVLVTPDGGRAFTADRKGNTLTVVNLQGEYASVVRRLPVGKSPGGMALDGAGRTLFVSLNDEARVVLIDAVTLEKTGEIGVGRGPDGVAFAPGWKR